jgi:hypothetical protein
MIIGRILGLTARSVRLLNCNGPVVESGIYYLPWGRSSPLLSTLSIGTSACCVAPWSTSYEIKVDIYAFVFLVFGYIYYQTLLVSNPSDVFVK